MGANLFSNYYDIVAIILFGIGFTTLLLHKNLIRKIIGLNIMDSATSLLLAAEGYIEGRNVPIIVDGVLDAEVYINPVPSGLVLTGIVVSVSVTAFLLALAVRLYKNYHTMDIDEIMMQVKKNRKSEER